MLFDRYAAGSSGIHYIRHTIAVLTAIALLAVPMLLATDAGGNLAWDWWALHAGAILLVIAAAIGRPTDIPIAPPVDSAPARLVQSLLRHAPLILLLGLAGHAALQTIPLHAKWVAMLSPASVDAYQRFVPEVTTLAAPERFPISVHAGLTSTFAWRLFVIAAVTYIAGRLFASPALAMIALAGLAVTGVVHSGLGFYQQATTPDVYFGGSQAIGKPFAAFINRNNAGALLNLGLAGSVGLLATLVQREQMRQWRRSWTRLMTDDPLCMLAVVAALVTLAAIFAAGSRGALVGAFAGGIAVAVAAVPSRSAALVLVLAGVAAVVAWAGLAAGEFSPVAIERIWDEQQVDRDAEGRLSHWADAWRATRAHLPAGAGMGAYEFAYLPFQQTSGAPWYRNADNQWLESLLEGGFVAAILFVLAMFAAILALRRLFRSQAPVDRGVGTAGVMALVAITVSQSFDFALNLSSVATAAAILAATVHARATYLAPTEEDTGIVGYTPLAAPRQPIVTGLVKAAVFLLVLGGLAYGLPGQTRRADSAALLAGQRVVLDDRRLDAVFLGELSQQVAEAIEADPWTVQLREFQMQLQRQLFRLEQTGRLTQQSTLPLVDAFRMTDLEKLRQLLRTTPRQQLPPAMAADEIADHPRAADAIRQSEQILAANPLSDLARWNIVQLDFRPGGDRRAESALEQLLLLRGRNGDQLTRMAEAAARLEAWPIAAEAWRRGLRAEPSRWRVFLDAWADADAPIPLHELLPTEVESLEQRSLILNAAKYSLGLPQSQQSEPLRDQALQLLAQPISQPERELKEKLAKPAAQKSPEAS